MARDSPCRLRGAHDFYRSATVGSSVGVIRGSHCIPPACIHRHPRNCRRKLAQSDRQQNDLPRGWTGRESAVSGCRPQPFSHLSGLELHCINLAEQVVELQPVELVHTALVFEHAGTGLCLNNAVSLVANKGALSIVLQLPASAGQNVGRTGFASIQRLASHFSLVDPMQLRETLAERSLQLVFESCRSLPAGKEFWMGIFVRK
jgi:hypothetical protein